MPRADRGSVWIVDLGLAAKVRPCLVLSVPTDPQDRVLVTLVPHTTSVQGTRFEVAVRGRGSSAVPARWRRLRRAAGGDRAASQVGAQVGRPSPGPVGAGRGGATQLVGPL